jgi:hypothetical protein
VAVYIPIVKLTENDVSVEYAFGPDERDGMGKLRIDKKTGDVEILATPKQEKNPEFYGPRAARKVTQHWRDGEFPDRTCWAA